MTCQEQDAESASAVELIAERGLDGLPDALSVLINEAMRVERERHEGAGRYERSDARRGYANGYKTRTMKTRMGALELRVPQVREGGVLPAIAGQGAALGAGAEAGTGADVRGGRVHAQGRTDHRAAVRL